MPCSQDPTWWPRASAASSWLTATPKARLPLPLKALWEWRNGIPVWVLGGHGHAGDLATQALQEAQRQGEARLRACTRHSAGGRWAAKEEKGPSQKTRPPVPCLTWGVRRRRGGSWIRVAVGRDGSPDQATARQREQRDRAAFSSRAQGTGTAVHAQKGRQGEGKISHGPTGSPLDELSSSFGDGRRKAKAKGQRSLQGRAARGSPRL